MDIHVPIASTIQPTTQPDETLWAKIVSFVISPPVVWAVWVYPISLSASDTTRQAIVHATLFTILVCVMPMVFVAYMVKLGKIGDLHMRESHERYIPYALSIMGSIVTGAILLQLNAHPVLLMLTLISVVQLLLMLILTFFHHISMHAMAIASMTSATAIVFSFGLSLMIVPVLLVVVLARLVLNRHTPAQLVAGTLIGALTPFLVIYAMNWLV